MFKMCYMKYFMFYVYYCTNCAVMFTYSSKMSDISTAGKRGRVWEHNVSPLEDDTNNIPTTRVFEAPDLR